VNRAMLTSEKIATQNLAALSGVIIGLEEESYGGTQAGMVKPLSSKVAGLDKSFRCEPDGRNIEFSTEPTDDVGECIASVITQRILLRDLLDNLGGYTIVPSGTIPLGNTSQFCPVTSGNLYYNHIERTWGTSVVTAGLHLSAGIEDIETLIRVSQVMRLESPLYLALSASSPFLGGKVTGYSSTRWHIFPLSPEKTPFFRNYTHYRRWVERQVLQKYIFNARNIWLAARPNGDEAPYELNRVEIRICDRIDDPALLLAVMTLFQARVAEVRDNPEISVERLLDSGENLERRATHNEKNAAQKGLAGSYWDWQSEQEISLRDFLEQQLVRLLSDADPVVSEAFDEVLRLGDVASRWLQWWQQGVSIEAILARAIELAEARDALWNAKSRVVCAK